MTVRMRRDNPIPMTHVQYLRWLNRNRPQPANDNGLDMREAPFPGHTIVATSKQGSPEDEVDAGFLVALRKVGMVVGRDLGQVPAAVAFRLFLQGWVVVEKESGE